MRALHLDYCVTSRASRAGTGILMIGVVVAASAIAEYRAARDELSVLNATAAELRKGHKRLTVTEPPSKHGMAAELKTAQSTLQRLGVPWNDLFASLESVRVDGVALLAIEPDAVKNRLKLTAEARSADDMLLFVERLRSTSTIGEATLAKHQLHTGRSPEPLRFDVLAIWNKSP